MGMTTAQCMDVLIEAGLYRFGGLYDEKAAVTDVTYDSKETKEGTLFFCKGAAFKPAYLEEAVRRGAVCYVSEEAYPDVLCSHLIVSDVRRAMAVLGAAFYGHADRALDLIGITGTKGKSTTAYYIKYILDEYAAERGEKPCGIISSIDTYDGKVLEESHLTTPEALVLHRHFANARDCGLSRMVMEVSSQALKYDRVLGVSYRAGVFLNISEDHISPVEHRDFEDYFSSKLKLFSQSQTAYINMDSDHAQRIAEAAKAARKVVTFGKRPEADFYGYQIRKEDGEIRFRIRCAQFDAPFALTMPGLFNVENALVAVAVCAERDIPLAVMQRGLYKARSSGRMEMHASADGKKIAIVDYAHNKLSFEKLFSAMRAEYPGWHIYAVYGCPGGKAYNRRVELGEIAGKYSDAVYLTMEDPGKEDTHLISLEAQPHITKHNCPCYLVDDRGEAIQRAILEAPQNTLILITGKGNETRQKIGTEYVPCKTDTYFAERALAEGFSAADIERQIAAPAPARR